MTKLRSSAGLLWVLLACLLMAPAATAAAPKKARVRAASHAVVPVTSQDGSWGSRWAPVTLVAFNDLQCPYCARGHETMEALKRRYGPEQLRVVLKHFPLAFHGKARDAAIAAEALRAWKGNDTFWRFVDAAYEQLKTKSVGEMLPPLGVNEARLKQRLRTGRAAKVVEADIALGKRLGVRGTPAFFINGVRLSGSQPEEKFAKVIDEQLAMARAALRDGTPRAKLYAALTERNYQPPSKRKARSSAKALSDKTVYRVPLDRSPLDGPRNALVTIVVFSDFQCPFCARLMPTFDAIERRYGKQVRFAFKHNPLPFHQRADEAARLSIHAQRRLGDRGFWRLADKLFEDPRKLEDSDLERIAREVGLSPIRALKAVRQGKYQDQIDADQSLARALGAGGTPTSFINGRKLTGAQPIERFAELIDEELTKAKALLKKGVRPARLYAHIMKNAKKPPVVAEK